MAVVPMTAALGLDLIDLPSAALTVLHRTCRNILCDIATNGRLDTTMTEPLVRLLDSVHVDEDRQYIEFRFTDGGDGQQAIQIDFDYVESLAALFQQVFLSAAMAARQGANSSHDETIYPCHVSILNTRSVSQLI